MVFGFYFENIFKEAKQKEMFMFQLQYLVRNVGSISSKCRIASVQACNSLKAIFEEEDVVKRISPMVNLILTEFLPHVVTIDSVEFFETLKEVVK